MSSDKQFTATGDADVGFQTVGGTIKTGVSVSGTDAGIVAAVPKANARGIIATGASPTFQQHAGVYGEADHLGVIGVGTVGTSTGVFGGTKNGDGFGIRGETMTGTGVQGQSFGSGRGLVGISAGGAGVIGESQGFDGVFGNSHHVGPGAGVSGHNDAGGPGDFGESLNHGSQFGNGD